MILFIDWSRTCLYTVVIVLFLGFDDFYVSSVYFTVLSFPVYIHYSSASGKMWSIPYAISFLSIQPFRYISLTGFEWLSCDFLG